MTTATSQTTRILPLLGLAATAGIPGCSDGAANVDIGPDAGISTCAAAWDTVTSLYPDATDLGTCDGVAGADPIVGSLMNVDGLTIDNNGTPMQPCIETRCDDTYVYVAANALPHYDFIQTTPNPLTENLFVYRVPLAPTAIDGAGVQAEDAAALTGCVSAYNQYVSDPGTGTNQEPGGYCTMGAGTAYLYDERDGARTYYHKIACLNAISFVINGVPVFGPNEAGMPDPWGSPVFFYPDAAGESYFDPNNLQAGAALDLCGGHTGNSEHYHGINEACFVLNGDNTPASSYVSAVEDWRFEAALTEDCSEESGIVGWSPDGYPIKGPCVCVDRNPDGSCARLARARSSWAYLGLSDWSSRAGAGNDTGGTLSVEGTACTTDADCCTGADCDYACSYAVFDDDTAPGGTTVDKRCVLFDYSWCTHQFVDRTAADTTSTNFVYLDRCNGYEGPDGYAYHATLSFPYIQGCYRGEPAAIAGNDGMGDGMGAPGEQPMGCAAGQTSMCCGDGTCDGPETATNCPADC